MLCADSSLRSQRRMWCLALLVTTIDSQSLDGPAPSTLEVKISTVSPEASELSSGTRRPLTRAPMQACPTSVWLL